MRIAGNVWQADYYGLCSCMHQLLYGSALVVAEGEDMASAARRGWVLGPRLAGEPPPDTLIAPTTTVKRYTSLCLCQATAH